MKLSSEELGTVLAALRLWQGLQQVIPPDLWDIATDGGTLKRLDDAGVEALAERLNGDDALTVIVFSEHDVDDRECLETISVEAGALEVGRQIVPCMERPSRFKVRALVDTYAEAKEVLAHYHNLREWPPDTSDTPCPSR